MNVWRHEHVQSVLTCGTNGLYFDTSLGASPVALMTTTSWALESAGGHMHMGGGSGESGTEGMPPQGGQAGGDGGYLVHKLHWWR